MRYIISSALSILPFSVLPWSALADVPRVITDIPPVYGLVAQVMGDLGQPILLLEKGADEHDFQLRPSQMRDITNADLAIWIGPELTPWLDRALEAAPPTMISLPLLDMPSTHRQEYLGPQTDTQGLETHAEAHDHHADAPTDDDHPDHTGTQEQGDAHDHSGKDPHAWLNPRNAAPWLDAIAAVLSEKDAANAATYSANAAHAKNQIAALDAALAAALSPIQNKGFVTYHDAYGYFAQHYALAYKGAIAMGDASAAGAAHLRTMQDQIAQNIVCVFPEVQHDADMLLQLIAGTKAKSGGPLDPVGASLDASPTAYEDVLRNMSDTLLACLNDT